MNLRFGLSSLLLCCAMLVGAFVSTASAQVNHDDRGRWHHSDYHRPSASSRTYSYNPNPYSGRGNAYYNGYDWPYYTRNSSPQSYYGYGDPYSYANPYTAPQRQYNFRPYSYSQPYYATPYGITPGYSPYGVSNGYGAWGW